MPPQQSYFRPNFWLSNAATPAVSLETVVDSVAAVATYIAPGAVRHALEMTLRRVLQPEGDNFCSNTRLTDRESEAPAFMPYIA
jgi:hypothetical protein